MRLFMDNLLIIWSHSKTSSGRSRIGELLVYWSAHEVALLLTFAGCQRTCTSKVRHCGMGSYKRTQQKLPMKNPKAEP